jgi:hypothetical protein
MSEGNHSAAKELREGVEGRLAEKVELTVDVNKDVVERPLAARMRLAKKASAAESPSVDFVKGRGHVCPMGSSAAVTPSTDGLSIGYYRVICGATDRAFTVAVRLLRCLARTVKIARTAAITSSAGTSPCKWPSSPGMLKACQVIIPERTMLENTVNQIKPKFASGLRDVSTRKTPRVA